MLIEVVLERVTMFPDQLGVTVVGTDPLADAYGEEGSRNRWSGPKGGRQHSPTGESRPGFGRSRTGGGQPPNGARMGCLDG